MQRRAAVSPQPARGSTHTQASKGSTDSCNCHCAAPPIQAPHVTAWKDAWLPGRVFTLSRRHPPVSHHTAASVASLLQIQGSSGFGSKGSDNGLMMHYKHFTQGGNHVPSFLAPAIPPAPEQESWCGTFLLCQAPEIDHVDDPAKHQTIHVAGPLQAFLHCKPLCQTCGKNQKLPQRSCTQEALAES